MRKPMGYEDAANRWNVYARRHGWTGCPASIDEWRTSTTGYGAGVSWRFAAADARGSADSCESIGWTRIAHALREGADAIERDIAAYRATKEP